MTPSPSSSPSHSPSRAPSQRELFRFLEERFACAQACTECARVCAMRASFADPQGTGRYEAARRKGIICAEACDATCRVLSEENHLDEHRLRVQLEWCRAVCLDSAQVFDEDPGAGPVARSCRACAQACTDFLSTLA